MSDLNPYGIQYKDVSLSQDEQKSFNLVVDVANAVDSHDMELMQKLFLLCQESSNKNKSYLIRILTEALNG